MTGDEPDDEEREAARERLRIYDGLAVVLADPVRFATIAAAAEDPDEALRALQEELGLDELQARAAMDVQVRRFTRRDVTRVLEERDRLRELVAE